MNQIEKKRKFNKNNIQNELNAVKQSNQTLKIQNDELMKERDEYFEGINILKQEAKKWKTKYLNLYSKISDITKVEAKELKTHNNSNKNAIINDIIMNNSNYKLKNNNKSIETKNNGITKHKTPKKKHKNGCNKTKDINNIKIKHRSKSASNTDIIHQKCINIIDNTNSKQISKNKTHKLIKRTDEMNKKNVTPTDKNITDETTGKYDEIRNQLFEMGFDKTKVIEKISKYNNSRETPQFVFNTLINKLTADTNGSRQLRSYTKKKRKDSNKKRKRPNFNGNNAKHISDSDYSSNDSNISASENENNAVEYIEFEKSYYVSVNCHICQKHFDNIFKYKNHLEEHYINDTNKTWLECEWGCNIKANDGMKFIRHIGTHTNNKPYHCNVKINGIKCTATMGYTRYLKNHWRSHFDMYIQSSDSESGNSESSESEIENNMNNKSSVTEYENCYYVSVNCHICEKHFNNFDKYKTHLEDHYNKDPNKTWRHCDQCNVKQNKLWINNVRFIGHIATHTKDKPFKCNMELDGNVKCTAAFSRKTDFKQHWEKHHKNGNKKVEKKSNEKVVEKKQERIVKEVVKVDRMGKNSYLFEDSYYVSVNCHLCKEHFTLFSEYRDHIRVHYDNDPLRQWLQCDFGCVIDPNKPLFSGAPGFLNHIAAHTKCYPFKCNKAISGNDKCKQGLGIKSDLKRHWIVYHKNNNKNKKRNSNKKKYKNKKNNSHYKNGYDRK